MYLTNYNYPSTYKYCQHVCQIGITLLTLEWDDLKHSPHFSQRELKTKPEGATAPEGGLIGPLLTK